MTDERFKQITPLVENATGRALYSGRPPKRQSGTRSKKASGLCIVGHTGCFQTQVSRYRPAKSARARRIVS